MTTGHANIHVKAGDKVDARYAVHAGEAYVVLDWDAPGCALFLPADVDTLDQHIEALMKVRVEVHRHRPLEDWEHELLKGSQR